MPAGCLAWDNAMPRDVVGNEPRAAYIHVPFCVHRCGYCNFTVVAGRDDLIERYLSALEQELATLEHAREVDTLFLGGGTPTHLSAAQIERLLRIVLAWFPLAPGGEFSLEANPNDIDKTRMNVLAAHGVSRISLGGQSFDSIKLATLQRDHDARTIAQAVDLVRGKGMSVSLDLIFAAPGELFETWRRDLSAAVGLSPDHISTYGLTFERGAQFWSQQRKGKLTAIDDETQRRMYLEAIDRLSFEGFEHYEVSNFAMPGHRCRHNEVYWHGASYFAAGPGAARYVHGRREVNHRSTTTWMNRVLAGESPVAESESLGPEDRAREALVLALRCLRGVRLQPFAERFGFEVSTLAGAALDEFLRQGLLCLDEGRLRLTREGLLVSDAIWPEFLRV